MRTIRLIVSAAALSGIMLLIPAPAHAQDAAKQQISASPFLIMYKYFNVEFERRATEAGTRATCVGAITEAASGVIATDAEGEAIVFTKTGWDHFPPPGVT